MSKNNPIDLKQDRRQWLKTSATVLGASLLPLPAVAAEASQAKSTPGRKPSPSGGECYAIFHPRTARAGRRVVGDHHSR